MVVIVVVIEVVEVVTGEAGVVVPEEWLFVSCRNQEWY